MAIARLRLRRTPRDPLARMGVIDHLEELRRRLLISAIAWILGGIVAWVFYDPILELIRLPLDKGGRIGDVVVEDLYVGGIATGFVLRIKIAAIGGLVLALPVILWQIFRFVAPGLVEREKKIAIPFFLSSMLLFGFGATIAYMMMPVAINWLLGFTVGPGLTPLLQFGEYVNFVTFMMLAFGLSFELPLLLVALGAVGAVSSASLRGKRGWALLSAFVIGAVATPGGDPLSQTLMAVPLYILYEASIVVIRFGFKK